MMRMEEIAAEMAQVRERLKDREYGTPNMRDYFGKLRDREGRDDFEQFQVALNQYHAETAAMWERLEALATERNALRQT